MARFAVTYWLDASDEAEARARALDITVEQTVEIPRAIVPKGYVEDEILGRIESLFPAEPARGGYIAEISYSEDDVGGDFLQLLNIVFGNSSIKRGIRVEDMRLSEGLLPICQGPRFGSAGLRSRADVGDEPVLMSAIKPVGLSSAQLARLAHEFALGGMNYVKDDHGLVDQNTAPYAERVRACAEAIGEANTITGLQCSYVPNITGPAGVIVDRAFMAKEAGAGGVMLAPSLAGYDIARTLAADPAFDLPIVSHPAFSGANVISPDTGFSHRFFYGTLQRLMGVDAAVYPNFGGRFGFTKAECLSITEGCTRDLTGLKPIMPAPGGGMTLERVPEMRATYGADVMYLIGGALLQETDIADACRRLAAAVKD